MRIAQTAKRIGLLAHYGLEFGREMVKAVLEYKFKSAAAPWHIAYIGGGAVRNVLFDDLRNARLDGLIAPVYRDVARYQSLGIPIVNTTEPLPDCPFPTVTFDNRAIGELAAREFADMEVSGCCWLDLPGPAYAARNGGFAAALEAHGIPGCTIPPAGWKTMPKGQPSTAGEGIPGIDIDFPGDGRLNVGIFSCDDPFGVGIIEICHARGWSIPDQVAVVGVNNDLIVCRSAVPELSSIDINPRALGARAAAELDRLLQGLPPTAHCMRIPPRGLARRQSSDRIHCDDPHVAAALRYIRAHIDEYFDVSDILRFSAISRRNLEIRFREHTGQGIYEAIIAQRLKRAEKLLCETNLPQSLVASRSGFPNLHAFHTAFRREHGMTPAHYRKQAG